MSRGAGVGSLPWQVERRAWVVALALAVTGSAIGLAALCRGAGWSSPVETVEALFGHGQAAVVVQQWRLPRVLAALVFGAALGIAGAIFQSLSRNPLGSPDIIGLDAGAYTGALVAITVLGGSSAQVATGSVTAGLAAAAAIWGLSSSSSGFDGLRLVIIGIAVNATLTALNSWIILRAELEVAIAATGWNAGSLNGLDWSELRLPLMIIGALLAVLVGLAHAVHQAELGDALAVTTGVRLDRLRVLLVLIGVGCTATVTAVAGPIVFIALAAPQIGRRLSGAAGVALLPAALTGAVLLVSADLLAQVLLAPVPLPVGVVTTAIGGSYLIWLLHKEVSKR